MPVQSPTNPASVTDYKKLYSSHVQENNYLQKQKSFIDDEKLIAYKHRSHEEAAFIRKYEKYCRGFSGRRRHSVDAGSIFKVAEANKDRDRDKDRAVSANKSLGRDTLNNDFPYSFSTWNKIVDASSDILECNKNEILRAPDSHTSVITKDNTVTVSEVSEKYTHTQKSDEGKNNSTHTQKSEEGKNDSVERAESESDAKPDTSSPNNSEEDSMEFPSRNRRKSSLKPIDKSLLSNDLGEEEIIELVSRGNHVKGGYRRHSVTPGFTPSLKLPKRRQSVDIGSMKLPSITEPFRKSSNEVRRKMSKSDPDLPSDGYATDNFEKSKHLVNPRVILNDSESQLVSLEKNDLSPFSPRPIPNAAVFVQGDSGVSERKFQNNLETCDGNSQRGDGNSISNDLLDQNLKNQRDGKTVTFLPDIQKSPTLVQAPVHDYLDTPEMRTRSVSFSSEISNCPSAGKSPVRRRSSMKTATLSLLVEHTTGAARLRYMAKLATEMEKEEKQKLNIITPPVTPDAETENPFKDVEGCRYLRTSKRNSNEEVDQIF